MKIRRTTNNISPALARRRRELAKVPAFAHRFFVSVTPKLTGNARRRTRLLRNTIIKANYPYAKRLDEGWSRKAPNGMVKPTFDYVRKMVRKIMRS